MKTIKVNDQEWIEVEPSTPEYKYSTNFMRFNDKFYIPKPKEKSLDDIYLDWHLKQPFSIGGQLTPKIRAIFKIMAVADYLNEEWKPNWKGNDRNKWGLYYNHDSERISLVLRYAYADSIAHFKDEQTAKRAIEILGEEVIKMAHS